LNRDRFQNQFFDRLADPTHPEKVFDAVSDTVYFIKDDAGRYVSVNETLVRRCRLKDKSQLIGCTASQVFPMPLGTDFTKQDLEVLKGGPEISNRLELHLYPGGESGWCLTWKKVLLDPNGRTLGLSGISRDIGSLVESSRELEELSQVLAHIRDHLDLPLTLKDLSTATGLSNYQIGQRMKNLFGLSPHQYIVRSRIEAARHKLAKSSESLSEIALACGFSDQSAFTRQFKQSVGITPRTYREQKKQAP
jgi:AraC-like DNA-binding protein